MQNKLKELFGLDINFTRIQAPNGLPLYMTAERSFYESEFAGVPFLIVQLPEQDKFGAVALEKQLAKYSEICGMNAAYWVSGLKKVQRDALVKHMIPFISPSEQVFLPFLAIALSQRFTKHKQIKIDHFSPSAQCLFLYFLYNSQIHSLLKKDAAKALMLTKTSISRASEQLSALGLLTEEAVGKEIRMSPSATGKAYYELGKPYLINPVSEVITIEAKIISDNIPYAGESALSKRSMLSSPAIPVFAVSKNDPLLADLKEIDEKWADGDSLFRMELWKYDPTLFSRDGIIDPASMAVSMEAVQDERVQGELEEFMEGILW